MNYQFILALGQGLNWQRISFKLQVQLYLPWRQHFHPVPSTLCHLYHPGKKQSFSNHGNELTLLLESGMHILCCDLWHILYIWFRAPLLARARVSRSSRFHLCSPKIRKKLSLRLFCRLSTTKKGYKPLLHLCHRVRHVLFRMMICSNHNIENHV